MSRSVVHRAGRARAWSRASFIARSPRPLGSSPRGMYARVLSASSAVLVQERTRNVLLLTAASAPLIEPRTRYLYPVETIAPGELVRVAGRGPDLDGIVFDIPSHSKVVVAVVEPGRGPTFRTVHPAALTERGGAGSRRSGIASSPRSDTVASPRCSARRRPRRERTPRPHARADAPHDRPIAMGRRRAWPLRISCSGPRTRRRSSRGRACVRTG